jgi:hypothetical protein
MYVRFTVDSICAENEYKCHRGPCIHQSMVCNMHVDCDLTWDDEEKCRKIYNRFFNNVYVFFELLMIMDFSFRMLENSV